MTIRIAPSLLAANLLRLEEEVDAVLKAGADIIHLDIMDNHYVPNLSFGPGHCQALRARYPNLPIDVHLMVSPVAALIEAFATAGATSISIHPDACLHLDRELSLIRALGCQVGLALNPATPLECLTYTHHLLDFVLIMTVNPGFGGQQFLNSSLPKIKALHSAYPQLALHVDGGVNEHNIAPLAQLGIETFIVGSGLFSSSNYEKTLLSLKKCNSLGTSS